MKRPVKISALAAAVGLLVGTVVWFGGANIGVPHTTIRLTSFGSALAASFAIMIPAWLDHNQQTEGPT